MGRKIAVPWHLLFSLVAGALYFFFVLPRWPELMGDTTHSLGTALRITTGALVALAALPVVFNLLRVRKPELGTPQLALTLRVVSIVCHVLAGALIIGTAISEIWLSLDAAGQYLFAIYGAAAAIALLGFFAFYLSFVAELPPPPPKPIKAKKPKKQRRRKEATEETEETEADEAEEAEAEETEEAETVTAKGSEALEPEPAAEAVEAAGETPETEETPEADGAEAAPARLRNRRPTGKGSHRMRRRRTRGGVAVEDAVDED
ncbi:hypothetical protein [Mycobacterium paraseoulense]|uniref:Transmembrane protein n=1 Tax=Mycobacterium paraseoulense TaxID=590652 RepID=A0A1X0IB53_9MYCO|nr:hypothetical protein [Mycobacterium paraseoulense]MCV7396509.1 hypothetical protein [Mycobacterium paraseoulense]ORB41996.1 hypothetical protein BST39_10875 [Mycobacterium paraseoulense]BBZ72412.1 hypothetical protein MPRS_35050 [Mycobacterium paraseoulense]